ncbi:MAG: hypothetical protein IJ757_04935 [Clostridiales bacterium]|nr:hypothetical protein [Clostridiales bacterium]
MNERNPWVVVIILILAGVMIFYMMYKVRKVDVNTAAYRTEQKTEELTAALNELEDYQLYVIGTLPEYMDGISEHVTLLTVGQANTTTLPVTEGTIGFAVFDEDGREIEHIDQRDYASYMMIIINTQEELTESALDAIQDAAVYNHVPVLLIGKNNIDTFREYMILVHKDYDDNASMFFEITRYPLDNPIDPEVVSSGGHAYADALLEFIRSAFEDPAVVYVDAPEIIETSGSDVSEATAEDEVIETDMTETEVTEDAA